MSEDSVPRIDDLAPDQVRNLLAAISNEAGGAFSPTVGVFDGDPAALAAFYAQTLGDIVRLTRPLLFPGEPEPAWLPAPGRAMYEDGGALERLFALTSPRE